MINDNQNEQNKEVQSQKETVSEQTTASSQEKTIPSAPSDKFNQDTYFALSSTQFEKLKSISEKIFKSTEEVLLATWIESRYGIVKEQTSLAKETGLPLAPELTFYAKYLLKKLGSRIAIVVIRADYKEWYEELNRLLTQIEDLVERAELVLKVAKLGLPQIPSFEALFISGDKAFLATLRNQDTSGVIPPTYVLSRSDLTKNFALLPKDKAVLKPGDLSRGEGIKFGKHFAEKAWQAEIETATNSPDGLVQGVASRVSASEVINVAKGGTSQAVILQGAKKEQQEKWQSRIEVPLKRI
ncbi:12001_t:CDS:2 [Entrophospora sp. SA101]|nr:14601_t:CDS:2 [Entrophospora sp. SA101]CAJ0906346.1 12001_t:CDS:2 [Entrophospora sp. SA101]